ncbi:PDE9A [Symbiodinium natans]|uniref:Phosphodiesterase n=1 Tax=Symbiodinium natans TaxID=878477 RepID=A0A812UA04_9DINO|nr:PDE9A [Symbiodinium natans]
MGEGWGPGGSLGGDRPGMGSCESFFFGPEPAAVEGANGQITKGLRVQTQYTIEEGGDGRWYMGTVKRLYAGNKCAIRYDDGDSWTGNARDVWSLNGPPPGAPPPGMQMGVPMGMPVVQGRGTILFEQEKARIAAPMHSLIRIGLWEEGTLFFAIGRSAGSAPQAAAIRTPDLEKGVLDIMDALIIAKANPFVKDTEGYTVMDLALASGDEEVIDTIRNFVGDLRRQDHPHLRMMEENMIDEAGLARDDTEAKQRREFLEPEEQEEATRQKVVIQEETLTEYFATLGEIARNVFKNQIFQAFMLFCLFVALFVADVFVIINVSNDAVLDAVLVVLMAAFLCEFVVQLLAYPRGYTCSFYFWMDLLGILSVPLDHSLVVNALPSGLDSNAVVMRAARMAKLGARAGRFTKLVKLLRFLPFMQQTSSGGTARVISATLNVALSMRVSLLIILMVLVLPLFSLATFPENDFSMRMWVETVGDTATLEAQYLEEVLLNFTTFYASSSYFPFQVSVDYGNGTVVTRALRSETPARSRASLSIQAASSSTMASFDFTQPQQVDSICNCLLIVTIVLLMVISALFLSNTVTHIVLTPLEALLDHVHHMAANIFKSMAALGTQASMAQTDEDDEHRDSADAFGTETRLLDQTLKKVIALSKITVKKSPIDSDSLRRLGGGGDLQWLQAYSTDAGLGEVIKENAELLDDMGLLEADVQDLAITIETKMTEVSISWDTFSLWELDTVGLTDKDRHNLNLCLFFSRRATSIRDKTVATAEWLERCGNFLEECQSGYDSGKIAPYHTWLHAVDATYTLYRIISLIAAEQYLGHLECFGILVAAIAHDMGHRGRSNVFLVEIGHELAIRYNDIAILENMHCSLLFQILSQEKMNIFSELSEPVYNHIRHVIVDAILATDFAQHTSMVKEFESMYGVNAELFDTADEMYMSMDEFPPNELLEYFKTPDVKKSLRTVLLHFSDISNPMKPFPVAEKWAGLVLEEFALQGDEEKALGIPVGPLNDRDTVNMPLSQIGFIEFVVAPLALSLARILPPLWFSNQMILDNANIWMDKWIEGTLLKPSLEEQVNVRERIHRMVQKTEQRGYTATMTALAPPT